MADNFDPYANLPSDFYYSPGASPGQGTPESGYFDPYANAPSDFYYSPGATSSSTSPSYFGGGSIFGPPKGTSVDNPDGSVTSYGPTQSAYNAYLSDPRHQTIERNQFGGGSWNQTKAPFFGGGSIFGPPKGATVDNPDGTVTQYGPTAKSYDAYLGDPRRQLTQKNQQWTQTSQGSQGSSTGWPHPGNPAIANWGPLSPPRPSNVSNLTPTPTPSHAVPPWLKPGYSPLNSPPAGGSSGGMPQSPQGPQGQSGGGGSPGMPGTPGTPWWMHPGGGGSPPAAPGGMGGHPWPHAPQGQPAGGGWPWGGHAQGHPWPHPYPHPFPHHPPHHPRHWWR
jgi:hypothetical protein